MAQYGYAYRSAQISTYNTSNARNIETGAKPFAPYVPKFNNGHGYSEGHVTKKKTIPVASRPYVRTIVTTPYYDHPRKFDDLTNEASRSPPDWPKPSYNGYADYGTNKPFQGKIKNYDDHDPVKKDNYHHGYDGYGDYNNKDEPKPKPTASPVYNSGYGGDYNNREGPKPKPKPTGIPVYKNGYGSGSASPTRRDNYDHHNDYGNYHNKHGGPKPTSDWTDSPRKGIQLTKATNNIDEAMKLLMKEAAMLNGNGSGNELVYNGSGPKPYEYDKNAHHDEPFPLGRRPTPPPPASTYDRSMNLVNETDRLKNIVTGGGAAPHQTQPRPSVPMKEETNFNLAPMRQRFNFGDDGRRPDYDNRRGYGVINHKEAEKKFNGVTLDHKEPQDKFNDMTI
ncbi:hypothetical protein AAZX31_20G215800 [Glycine max]|uniref:Uncharacterized protein n=1 Tax=Glycine max TaxID=3847 RepID=K7N560_SOYBN|nr:hypothetical protein GmHk_20G059161 [Glycine max]KRG92785.1 hypothetical protein GLYMA_20G229700v4 [Glycine max]